MASEVDEPVAIEHKGGGSECTALAKQTSLYIINKTLVKWKIIDMLCITAQTVVVNSRDLISTSFNYAGESHEEYIRDKCQLVYGSRNWNKNERVPQFLIPRLCRLLITPFNVLIPTVKNFHYFFCVPNITLLPPNLTIPPI